jgi:hypothetical protein
MDWISVNDDLPPEYSGVIAAIVQDAESYYVSEMYFDGVRFKAPWVQLDKEGIYNNEVQFWMPLPKPPEFPED